MLADKGLLMFSMPIIDWSVTNVYARLKNDAQYSSGALSGY